MFLKRPKFLLLVLVLFIVFSGAVIAAQYGPTIEIDGKEVETDVEPQIIDGRTMVPIRFIAEHFGADVSWVSETRTVEIISSMKQFADNFLERDMYQISADDALTKIEQEDATILDVRPPEHREQGYIAGSMHMPLPQIPEMMEEFESDVTYLVYCVMDTNSAFAVAMLNMSGIDAYVISDGMEALQDAGAEVVMDIVDTAIAAGSFDTLATALEAADLVDALKEPGPFTVFAPTDEAFDALPEGTLEDLLDDIPELTEILLYHVVSGEYWASDVVEAAPVEVETLQGSNVSITLENGNVFVDEAQVVVTDIECTNGIIHVIDAVILP